MSICPSLSLLFPSLLSFQSTLFVSLRLYQPLFLYHTLPNMTLLISVSLYVSASNCVSLDVPLPAFLYDFHLTFHSFTSSLSPHIVRYIFTPSKPDYPNFLSVLSRMLMNLSTLWAHAFYKLWNSASLSFLLLHEGWIARFLTLLTTNNIMCNIVSKWIVILKSTSLTLFLSFCSWLCYSSHLSLFLPLLRLSLWLSVSLSISLCHPLAIFDPVSFNLSLPVSLSVCH